MSFRDTPASEWDLGPAKIRAESVTHRGPTLGYRITDGPTPSPTSRITSPASAPRWSRLEPEWISGYDLARDADLLIHDCQYTDEEYPEHVGWGHSRLTDTLTFARRVEAQRLLMFHHDPLHSDDFLDRFHDPAQERWSELGGPNGAVEMAAEAQELEIRRAGARSRAAAEPRVACRPRAARPRAGRRPRPASPRRSDGPTSITERGSPPSVNPAGIVAAGCPV